MKIKAYILLIALLSFSSASISAQNKISGIVTDSDGLALIGASISLKQNHNVLKGTVSDIDGKFSFHSVKNGVYNIEVSYTGYTTITKRNVELKGKDIELKFILREGEILDELVMTAYKIPLVESPTVTEATITADNISSLPTKSIKDRNKAHQNREGYDQIIENKFIKSEENAFSTFGIDVDRASYSNVRRMIKDGYLPPVDAVRVEEMINYFDYEYPDVKSKDPFSFHHQVTACPWNDKHQILHIGMQGKRSSKENLVPSNLVFLIDVSGSMRSRDKLGLVKESLTLLLDQLKPTDRIAIVVYAGSSGLVLPSTPIRRKSEIFKVLDNLRAGGSTAGGAGIQLAYKVAQSEFMKDGNNRVILCTDGDFNVGINSHDDLLGLIEEKKKSNVFLTVLGFGTGNYQDGKMQLLADKGNGNHFYIDSRREAEKVFIQELSGSLHTLAKDVKLQLEFNPKYVKSYRLIGYENRILNKEDFDDDKKDAGELGMGHSVTALYEIEPNQTLKSKSKLAEIKFRYKKPKGNKSRLIKAKLKNNFIDLKDVPARTRFALAVAEFGLILRRSEYIKEANFDRVLHHAISSFDKDPHGVFNEFVDLVESAKEFRQEELAKR